MEATLEQAKQLGLTEDEFEMMKAHYGRTPNFTETAVYSVMWSEHCSYKNSIKYLKKLPKTGNRVLAAAGEENAGLIDIGDGLACSFKIESHNHPSAIEPFQGAATGVGGIHRDIFTMGARPIATLNSLRFGKLEDAKTKHLLKGVVSGIGHYGNCFGVPTVAGETFFDESYSTNPLVNAMSVGIAQAGKTLSAISYGVGNPVFIVGSDTGKDGIGGASFASADIDEDSAKDLPAVQVGDPFQEKKLMEACMELLETDCIVGMQDMGAAGIACSTSEMSAKGEHGMKIDLDKVPTRQDDMLAWEMLCSESQERMLVVVKKGHEADMIRIFDKWDIHCEQIGEVTEGDNLEFYHNGELVANMSADHLVLGGGAPVYDREYAEPKYMAQINAFSIDQIEEPTDLKAIAKKMLALPNICSKRWVYNQYDSMVGTANASTNAPSDAAMLKVKGTDKGIAASVDCNSRFVYANPKQGGLIAVSECARNISCTGALPLAVTNCLNFGNPYNPEVYFQFVKALEGMSEACVKFDTPVTGGNVSFYNQSPDGAVYPTPTIGMIGLLENIESRMTLDFKNEGDLIYILGTSRNDINSSEYLYNIHNVKHSPTPHFDLEEEFTIQKTVRDLVANKKINSAHDVSDGGLFVSLIESAKERNLGFDISCKEDIRKDAFLFGESQSRIIVSVSADKQSEFEGALVNINFEKIGAVTSGDIKIDDEGWERIEDYVQPYNVALEAALG
jgi:phosphoribosylformylglycinamidine synthase